MPAEASWMSSRHVRQLPSLLPSMNFTESLLRMHRSQQISTEEVRSRISMDMESIIRRFVSCMKTKG